MAQRRTHQYEHREWVRMRGKGPCLGDEAGHPPTWRIEGKTLRDVEDGSGVFMPYSRYKRGKSDRKVLFKLTIMLALAAYSVTKYQTAPCDTPSRPYPPPYCTGAGCFTPKDGLIRRRGRVSSHISRPQAVSSCVYLITGSNIT